MSDDRAKAMQDIGIAIQQGGLPTSKEAVAALEQVQESKVFEEASSADISSTGRRVGDAIWVVEGKTLGGYVMPLGEEGRREGFIIFTYPHLHPFRPSAISQVLIDTLEVLESTKDVIKEKFPHDELQHVMTSAGGARKMCGEFNTEQAYRCLSAIGSKAAHLVRLIITDAEFRSVILNISGILQDSVKSNLHEATSDESVAGDVGTSINKAIATAAEGDSASPLEPSRTTGIAQGDAVLSGPIPTPNEVLEQAKDTASHGEDVNVGKGTESLSRNDDGRESLRTQALAPGSIGEAIPKAKEAASKVFGLSDDKKEEIINKTRSVAKIIQTKPEFQAGLDELINLIKEAYHDIIKMGPAGAQVTPEAREFREIQTIIENFAGGRSLDPLTQSLRDLCESTRTDEKLQTFWANALAFVNRAMRDPAIFHLDNFENLASDVFDDGTEALRGHEELARRVAYEARGVAQAIAHDRTTRRMADDVEALLRDLFLDERGRPEFKPQLIRDLGRIMPKIADELAYLPVPRVVIDEADTKFIFDNILLRCSILPKYIRLISDTTMDASKDDGFENVIKIDISQIKASAKDVAWLYNKHKGLFKAGDVGLADVSVNDVHIQLFIVPGIGDAPVRVEDIAKEGGGRYLKVDRVHATVYNLNLKLHDSRHDFLYKMFSPFIKRQVRKAIERAIEDALVEMIAKISDISRPHIQIDNQMATAAV
ncbi:hypothetical protein BDK51DRAFT_28742 [Blyttiomyces helicus]|uniref:Uncharacterized protein n=1 Tax=Blyttiomyces helicus TaxID=388810 RepID=A0A4P9WAM0_9FUNG|nr:hypothetical protein BDK51DRAFT_28742 [Blyttiomyces helicus]|eukprot:RKO88563.1 hypothetical protein BDK51DRAFT_28742 [Blyttiomyces helicus]